MRVVLYAAFCGEQLPYPPMPSPLATTAATRPAAFTPPVDLPPNNTLVLLGAGSSVDAGYPAGRELDALFREEGLSLYTQIADSTKQGRTSPDVERVIRVIEHFAEYGPDSLAHDLAMVGITYGELSRWRTAERLAGKAQRELQDIMRLMRETLWKRMPFPTNGDAESDVDYLKPMIDAMVGGTIATLNYDNSIELAGGKTVVTTTTKTIHVDVPSVSAEHVRLLKLHGSLDWRRVEDDVLRDAKPSEKYLYEPGIIFGAGNKLRAYGPYLQLLRAFHDRLSKSKNLVVIGYSWRDQHINAEVRRWAKGNAKTLYIGVMQDSAVPREVNELERHSPNLKVDRRIGDAGKVIRQLFGKSNTTRTFTLAGR